MDAGGGEVIGEAESMFEGSFSSEGKHSVVPLKTWDSDS
jgi:uncharacterized protein YbbC (DUF1343 family)